MTDGRPTRTPLLLPPGYFKVRSTGRVHLVRAASRVAYPDDDAWIAVSLWCSGISTDRKGTLLAFAEVDCPDCEERRFRNLPRARVCP